MNRQGSRRFRGRRAGEVLMVGVVMVRVLPLTVAEMLEDELEHVHGGKRVEHDWEFRDEEVDSLLVIERIKANPLSDAYEYLHSRLGTTTTRLWEEFNKWNTNCSTARCSRAA